MNLPGMSLPAASSIDLRWGDTALASFFGTSARADAADPSSSVAASMFVEPEGVASPFIIQGFDSIPSFRANEIAAYAASAKRAFVPGQTEYSGAFLLIVVVALIAFVVAMKVRM